MNATDYQRHALSTFKTKGLTDDLLHAGLGLISEAGELVDAYKRLLAYGKPLDHVNIVEECGDLLWYAAILSHSMDFEISMFRPEPASAEEVKDENPYQLVIGISFISSKLAAICALGADPEKEDRDKVGGGLILLFLTVDRLCVMVGSTLEAAMEANIAKLAKRYPEGFTEYRALNRDLDAERSVLEGADKAV